jgi:hypothetical protein
LYRYITGLFGDQGMELEELAVHERAITNRGQGVRMDRRWVQASYASAEAAGEPLPPPPPPEEPAWVKRRRAAEAAAAAAEEVAAAGRTVAKEEAAAAATEREEAAAAVGACDRTRLEDFMLELLEEGRVAPRELLTRLTSRRVKQSEDFAHLHLNLQDFDEDF